jgi:hypothetical protein
MRRSLGGKFCYLWVPEWHQHHGLHINLALRTYIPKSTIDAAWGHGWVHVKRLDGYLNHDAPDDDTWQMARAVARYAAKDIDRPRPMGMHRYDTAQGFRPPRTTTTTTNPDDAFSLACDLMGSGTIERSWSSVEAGVLTQPPTMYWSWQ